MHCLSDLNLPFLTCSTKAYQGPLNVFPSLTGKGSFVSREILQKEEVFHPGCNVLLCNMHDFYRAWLLLCGQTAQHPAPAAHTAAPVPSS